MNNNQTLEKLRQMRLPAMASLHRQHLEDNRIESMGTDEYLALLVDHQWEDRLNRKIARLINQACFKQRASLVEIAYGPQRNLDKNSFVRLGTLDFIKRKEKDRKSTRLNSSHVRISYAVFCLKKKKNEKHKKPE